MIRRAFNRSGSEKTDAFEGAAVAGQLGSTWGDMGCTVRGKIEGHIHLLGCQQLLFVFFLAQRFLFYGETLTGTDRRVMSCLSHAVGLTSVKATAQWDELQRGLEAVLRVPVSSGYLSLVVFCGQF